MRQKPALADSSLLLGSLNQRNTFSLVSHFVWAFAMLYSNGRFLFRCIFVSISSKYYCFSYFTMLGVLFLNATIMYYLLQAKVTSNFPCKEIAVCLLALVSTHATSCMKLSSFVAEQLRKKCLSN